MPVDLDTTLPADGPATLAGTKAQLDIPASDTADDARIDRAVEAVNVVVRSMPGPRRQVRPATETDPAAWSAATVLGADMLAARVFKRHASPGGVEATSNGGVVYTLRTDPEVAALLMTGDYESPQVR